MGGEGRLRNPNMLCSIVYQMILCHAKLYYIIVYYSRLNSQQSSSVITYGVSRDVLCFVNRRLVTPCYGASIVAKQGHVRQSWMSRVKHPILRLSQHVTT